MNYGYDLTGPLSKQGAEEFVSVLKQALTAYRERSHAPACQPLPPAAPPACPATRTPRRHLAGPS